MMVVVVMEEEVMVVMEAVVAEFWCALCWGEQQSIKSKVLVEKR